MPDRKFITSEWHRTVWLAEHGDSAAIARMGQLIYAVLDVRESFLDGRRDAPAFAREIAVLQTASLVAL